MHEFYNFQLLINDTSYTTPYQTRAEYFDEKWKVLSPGINDIINNKTISRSDYIKYHDIAYFMSGTHGGKGVLVCDMLYDGVYEIFDQFVHQQYLLMNNITRGFLLEIYINTYSEFINACKKIRNIFHFMHRTWFMECAGKKINGVTNPIFSSFVELGTKLWTQKCHKQLKPKICVETNLLRVSEHNNLYSSINVFINSLERNSTDFTINLLQLSQEISQLPNATRCLSKAMENIYILKIHSNIIIEMPTTNVILHQEILLIRCPQLLEHKDLFK